MITFIKYKINILFNISYNVLHTSNVLRISKYGCNKNNMKK